MGNLTLTTKNNYGYTAISNIFISSFVPEANGEFVKVYLYLLHLISTGNSNISISLLADTFNQTEADIMRALRYWDKLNVISLTFAGNNDSLSNITINDFSSDNSATSTTKADFNNTTFPETAKLASAAAIAPTVPAALSYNISEGPKHVEPSSMQYSAEKISELNSDENFSMLLYVIES